MGTRVVCEECQDANDYEVLEVLEVPDQEKNRLTLQRDLALRQAKLARADLQVMKLALNDNRPPEALSTTNNAIDRLEEELKAVEKIGDADDGRSASEIAEESDLKSSGHTTRHRNNGVSEDD